MNSTTALATRDVAFLHIASALRMSNVVRQLDDISFIRHCYNRLLRRDPETEDHMGLDLSTSEKRLEYLFTFLDSEEYRHLCDGSQYFAMFGLADALGFSSSSDRIADYLVHIYNNIDALLQERESLIHLIGINTELFATGLHLTFDEYRKILEHIERTSNILPDLSRSLENINQMIVELERQIADLRRSSAKT